MPPEKLPRAADIERICELCGLVGSSPEDRSTVYEISETSERTTRKDISYALALGLMDEDEEGIRATNLGLDVSHTTPEEARRAELFRTAIAGYEPYATLTSKITATADDDVFERRDVDRFIRTSVEEELKDGPRKQAATTFLQTLDTAGIGRFVRARGDAKTRLEVEDHDAIDELVSLIEGDDSSMSAPTSEDTTQAPTQEPASSVDPTQEDQQPRVAVRHRSSGGCRFEATLDIQLELDGTEDPEQVRELVGGIREELLSNESADDAGDERSPTPDPTPKDKSSESETSSVEPQEEAEPIEETEDEQEEGSSHSSLGDFE